jgi:hypothetical protein
LIFFTAVERGFSKLYFLLQLVSILLSTFVKILSLARPCIHARVVVLCMLHATKDRTKSLAFRHSLSQMANLEWPPVVPTLSACLEPGGMGLGHFWGPFASFLLVRGDDGDLPETSA